MKIFLTVVWFLILIGVLQEENGGAVFLVSLLGIPLISSWVKNIEPVELIDLTTNKPINENNKEKAEKKTQIKPKTTKLSSSVNVIIKDASTYSKRRITDKQIEGRLFSFVEIYKNNNYYEIFYLDNIVYSLNNVLEFSINNEIEKK